MNSDGISCEDFTLNIKGLISLLFTEMFLVKVTLLSYLKLSYTL